jgi:membrane dipeptidase
VIPVIDGHNDALTREDHAQLATGRDGGDLDIPRMRAGGIRGAIFAVFTSSEGEREEPLPRSDGVRELALAAPVEHARAAADAAGAAGRLLALERGGHVHVARRLADIDRAIADGANGPDRPDGRDRPDGANGPDRPNGPDGPPPAAILHLEGAEAIDPGLEALDFWYGAGLRSIGPVWSRSNAFGHGVPFIFPSSPDTGPGLTDAGRALVKRCAELGILIDLSHLNEAGFWDVAAIDAGPLVASHSGAHALCEASRNLTDAQLDATGASGGLVGIVFACPFLRPDFSEDTDTPIELIARHARYVADRIGVEHVALGSDFDGAPIPAELGDAAGMQKVLASLEQAGFCSDEIEAIAWRNWRRVLAAWWRE